METAEKPLDSHSETDVRSGCLTQLEKKRLKGVKGPEKASLLKMLKVQQGTSNWEERRNSGKSDSLKRTENADWLSGGFVS